MKKINKLLMLLSLCWLSLLLATSCASQSGQTESSQASAAKAVPPTIVYVVRHAEKSTENPQDPDLSADGLERARDLKNKLLKLPVKALYATKYKRTQHTLQPLAQALSLPVQTYEAADFAGLAQNIKDQHLGQTVVIAGHSNTVLPIISALGATPPLAQIAEDQYHYLFKVTLPPNGAAQVETLTYGSPSPLP